MHYYCIKNLFTKGHNKMAPVPTLLRNVVQGAILPLRGARAGKLAASLLVSKPFNNEKEHLMIDGITYGKFSRADSKGVYAIGCMGEERLIATWQPDHDLLWEVGEDGEERLIGSNFIKDNYTCVPHAERIERFEDGYVIKLFDSNVHLHVSA